MHAVTLRCACDRKIVNTYHSKLECNRGRNCSFVLAISYHHILNLVVIKCETSEMFHKVFGKQTVVNIVTLLKYTRAFYLYRSDF